MVGTSSLNDPLRSGAYKPIRTEEKGAVGGGGGGAGGGGSEEREGGDLLKMAPLPFFLMLPVYNFRVARVV